MHSLISKRIIKSDILVSNFVGTNNYLKELYAFLNNTKNQRDITDAYNSHSIQWKFIPVQAPHFGGLWEAAVKSVKVHLHKREPSTLVVEKLVMVLT